MLSWLCIFVPVQLGTYILPLCNPASAVAPALAPATAIDGTHLSPLTTSGRWIVDTAGKRVKMRCINWSGSLDLNIPEGLSHRTPESIADFIGDAGFNCVRLTYSIDMALSGSKTVAESFTNVSQTVPDGGTAPGQPLMDIYNTAIQVNPWLANSTLMGTFAKVISALGDKGIRVILDNHLSKAGWCCNPIDGNGWWDEAKGYTSLASRYFNTTNWLAGLRLMSGFAHNHPNVVAMSLRNELRAVGLADEDFHDDWYKFTTLGAQAIREANSDLMVVFGGDNSALTIPWIRFRGHDLTQFNGTGKTIYEMHAYQFSYLYEPIITSDCNVFLAALGANAGYLLEQNQTFTAPLWLSEFGVGMTGGPHDGISDAEYTYLTCLVKYMEGNDAEWALWALQGNYYLRQGTVDYDEGFGLLNHNWTDLRNPKFPAMLGGMWNITQGP